MQGAPPKQEATNNSARRCRQGDLEADIRTVRAGSAHQLMRLRNRTQFLTELPHSATVFDVGCGNDSPYLFKSIRPDVRYVGLDVGDYNQEHAPHDYADEYVVISPEAFVDAIERRHGQFDAVVSSHNLEHCSKQDEVVIAMARSLKPGGRIFLAFPAAATVKFPSRAGTLNFYDDATHVRPPNYHRVLDLLKSEAIDIDFASERRRSPIMVAIGLVNESRSRRRRKVMLGTWALFGFETVIWGTKQL